MAQVRLRIILFLCFVNLHSFIESAFVLNKRLEPRNPFAVSEIVEGDILVYQNINYFRKAKIQAYASASTVQDAQLWSGGIIPYELDFELKQHKDLIEAAMLHIMMQSCVYFRPKLDGDRQHVWIHKAKGCSATVGRYNTGNEITLGDGCYHFGIIVHELMHILGFNHEQNRHDRDNYLKIHYDNINNLKENRANFDAKAKWEERNFTEFDYDSIMMYGETYFGIDGKITIEPLIPGKSIGQRSGLSPLDVKSINLLYKCDSQVHYNLACTKLAQTLVHMKNCDCSIRKFVDLNSLKKLYKSCKNVITKI